MTSTSLSILERAKARDSESAWRDFEGIYTPLLRVWLRRYDVAENDVDDLVQEVLLFVSERLDDFQHNGRTDGRIPKLAAAGIGSSAAEALE